MPLQPLVSTSNVTAWRGWRRDGPLVGAGGSLGAAVHIKRQRATVVAQACPAPGFIPAEHHRVLQRRRDLQLAYDPAMAVLPAMG